MAPQVSNKEAELRKLGKELSDKAEASLVPAKTTVDSIDVGFPNYSVLGLPIYLAHKVFQNQASESIFQARETIKSWKLALDKTADSWHGAETESAPHTN